MYYSLFCHTLCSAIDPNARSVCVCTHAYYTMINGEQFIKFFVFVHSHLNTLTHTHINTQKHTHSHTIHRCISHEIIPMSIASTEGTRCHHQHRIRKMVTLLLIEIAFIACVDIDSFLCCCTATKGGEGRGKASIYIRLFKNDKMTTRKQTKKTNIVQKMNKRRRVRRRRRRGGNNQQQYY